MFTYQLLEHTLVQYALVLPAMVVFLFTQRRREGIRSASCATRLADGPTSVAAQPAATIGVLTWLLYSKQFQCFSNSARQFSRNLVILRREEAGNTLT